VTRSRNDARETMLFIAALGSVAVVMASLLFYVSMRTLRQSARAEVDIRDLNEHLEKRVRERTREIEGFAYTVAHDLRAPLRAMAGFSDIIADESGQALGDSGRESLRRIRRAALRMDELIQGILSLARLSYQSFIRIPVDLSEIVREVVDLRNKEILEAGARVEIRASAVRALGDPSLLVLTMDHLLANALKFVSPGVKPHVFIQVEARGTSARVSVRDHGIGVPPEYHKRVFGVFERLHPNEAFPGVGVGLALVQRAVERMGGVVGVEANLEGGATFWIELDVAAAAEGTPPLLHSSSKRS
jgi:signal transduction histidine kinase